MQRDGMLAKCPGDASANHISPELQQELGVVHDALVVAAGLAPRECSIQSHSN